MKFERLLDLEGPLKRKSHFLFGPRSTGKTTLLKKTFTSPSCVMINLLDSSIKRMLLADPSALESLILGKAKEPSLVVIDEIQKVPELLDEVQKLIDENGWRFLLTGSSARRLRLESVNLLGGRANLLHLFPLCAGEFKDFDLNRYLWIGGLPAIWNSTEPEIDLGSYIDLYITEEIEKEARLRNIPQFHRFLQVAALQNGQLNRFTEIASDCQAPESTVRTYFQLLTDTLLGHALEPWRESKKRKAISTQKFYFFDIGVLNQLQRLTSLNPLTPGYGVAFEHFVWMELRAYLAYRRLRQPLTFWRSESGFEVDFLVGDRVAIEVKTKKRVTDRDLKGLRALREEGVFKRFLLVSFDTVERNIDGIELIHWQRFLRELWGDGLGL